MKYISKTAVKAISEWLYLKEISSDNKSSVLKQFKNFEGGKKVENSNRRLFLKSALTGVFAGAMMSGDVRVHDEVSEHLLMAMPAGAGRGEIAFGGGPCIGIGMQRAIAVG